MKGKFTVLLIIMFITIGHFVYVKASEIGSTPTGQFSYIDSDKAKENYNPLDTTNGQLKGYLNGNTEIVDGKSNWVGDDFAVWTNNAYTDLLSKLDETNGYRSNSGDLMDYTVIAYDKSLELNFDYNPGSVYSGKEIYFFSKEALEKEINYLTQLNKKLIAENQDNSIDYMGHTNVMTETMSVVTDLFHNWKTYGECNMKYEDYSSDLIALINYLVSILPQFEEGKMVIILQLDYTLIQKTGMDELGTTWNKYELITHFRHFLRSFNDYLDFDQNYDPEKYSNGYLLKNDSNKGLYAEPDGLDGTEYKRTLPIPINDITLNTKLKFYMGFNDYKFYDVNPK